MCWPTPEVTRYRPYGCDGRSARIKAAEPPRLILQSARKPLRLNTPILGSFTAKSLYCLIRNLTLNQRVQGSSPCAPTNDFNNLEQLLFGAPDNGNGLRTPCGPGKQLHVTGLRSTRWNDIAPAAQPLDRQIPHPRWTSSGRGSSVRAARTVARRLGMMAKSRIY